MPPSNVNARLDPPKGRESRNVKIAGLALIAVALPPLLFLQDQVESKAWQVFTDPWTDVFFVLLFLGAANLSALGLIVLLAGFKNLPLLTDARARRGVKVKMVGANLLILCFGLVALQDLGAFGQFEELWIVLPVLALFFVFGRTSVVLLRRGWKHDAVSAEKVLAEDRRQPVVYIRSFKDDEKIFVISGRVRRFFTFINWMAAVTVEQELATIMHRVGPVVAIGKPGEPLPELGAARVYVGDDEWRSKITDLMKQARLVVIRAGATANLWWEIDQAARLLPPRQLVIVALGQGEEGKIFDQDIERRFGPPESVGLPAKTSLLWRLLWMGTRAGNNIGKLIYFGADSKPYSEPIRFFVLNWKGLILSPIRPYYAALDSAFRRVFKELDLPWTDEKSRTTAALLALFVGFFGLHHFYLGNKRRGLYYLGFSWTTIPLFLAWIDAIRFALTDEQEFQRQLNQRSPS